MKKILIMLLIVCIALTATGCGKKTEENAPTPIPTGSAAETKTVVPVSWLTTGDTAAEPIEQGDRIVAKINELLGIELTVDYVPEGSTAKVNEVMTSGELPDIVTGAYGSSATLSWIDEGKVIPLNDYLDQYPYLKLWMEDYGWTAIDGKYYGIPFITQMRTSNSLIMMNGAWLDALGLAYPSTLDEMTEVLTAFTTGDPDGNGIDDTCGITGDSSFGTFDWVFYAYGRQYSDYALDANGQVIPLFEDGTFVESMRYIKNLYDAGIIDPAFLSNDIATAESNFYEGRAGAYPAHLYRHIERHTKGLQAVNPDAYIAYGKPPVGPDGKSYGLSAQGKTGFLTCITSDCADPDKALALLNLMVSPDGNDLVRLGIEGIHYSRDEFGNITYHEEERAKDAFSPNGWAHALAWGSLYWALESGYFPSDNPWAEKALETVYLASHAQIPALIPQQVSAESEYAEKLTALYNNYFVKMLTGELDIEEGLAELSREWRAQGGGALLHELNEVYSTLQ